MLQLSFWSYTDLIQYSISLIYRYINKEMQFLSENSFNFKNWISRLSISANSEFLAKFGIFMYQNVISFMLLIACARV